MKIKKILLVLLVVLIVPIFFVACERGKDNLIVPPSEEKPDDKDPEPPIEPTSFVISASIDDGNQLTSQFVFFVEPGAMQSAVGNKTFAKNSSPTYVIIPASNKAIKSVIVDGNEVFENQNFDATKEFLYTFENISRDHTIAVKTANIITPSLNNKYVVQSNYGDFTSNIELYPVLLGQGSVILNGGRAEFFIPSDFYFKVKNIVLHLGSGSGLQIVSLNIEQGLTQGFDNDNYLIEEFTHDDIEGYKFTIKKVDVQIKLFVKIELETYTALVSKVENGIVVDTMPTEVVVFVGAGSPDNARINIQVPTDSEFLMGYYSRDNFGYTNYLVEGSSIEDDFYSFNFTKDMLFNNGASKVARIFYNQIFVSTYDKFGNRIYADIKLSRDGIVVSDITGINDLDFLTWSFASEIELNGNNASNFSLVGAKSSKQSDGKYIIPLQLEYLIGNENYPDQMHLFFSKTTVKLLDRTKNFEEISATTQITSEGITLSGVFNVENGYELISTLWFTVDKAFSGSESNLVEKTYNVQYIGSGTVLVPWSMLVASDAYSEYQVYFIVIQEIETKLLMRQNGEYVDAEYESFIENGKLIIETPISFMLRAGVANTKFNGSGFSGDTKFVGVPKYYYNKIEFDIDANNVFDGTIYIVLEIMQLEVYEYDGYGYYFVGNGTPLNWNQFKVGYLFDDQQELYFATSVVLSNGSIQEITLEVDPSFASDGLIVFEDEFIHNGIIYIIINNIA